MRRIFTLFLLQCILLTSTICAQVGPGLGNLTYTNAELYNRIWSYTETNHMGSTMATMYKGYLITTFHPDSGRPPGGILVWDVSNPRSPKLVRRIYNSTTSSFREMHALPQHSDYILFQDGCGFQIWSFADPTNPQFVKRHCMTGYAHDDYGSNWQMFWQAPYIYIANGSRGFDVVDATDIQNPYLVRHVTTPRQVGPIFAVGNLLVTSAHDFGRGFTLYDISNPRNPQMINSFSNTENMYAASLNGNTLVISARGNANNAIFGTYDISDPINIKKLGTLNIGNNGEQLYSATQDNFIFQGCQDEVVKIDASNPSQMTVAGRGHLVTGDVDHGQVSPFGNLIFVGNDHGSGSGFWVHQAAPDTKAPEVNMIYPKTNAVSQALTSRIGMTLTDNLTPESINSNTFIVRPVGGSAIAGRYSYQFATINFSPNQPLQPNTTYEIVLPAGGIKDAVGNGIATTYTSYFSTGPTGEFPPAKGGKPWVYEADEEVNVFWNPIANANSYVIKRSISPNGPFATVGTANGTMFTDTDVENDQNYYYTVSGVNGYGEGVASSSVRAMPAVYITDFNWASATNGWGPVEIDQSNGEDLTNDGNYISLNGKTYSRGLGVHALSNVTYNIPAGTFERFTVDIGLDDEVGTGGSVIFSVLLDGQQVYTSGLLTGQSATQTVDLDISNASTITLRANPDGDVGLDHASWGGARFKRTQRPYNTPHLIPGKIELEEYDLGGNNHAYYDGTPGSQTGVAYRINEDVDLENCTDVGGGYNLGWTTAGEWVEYTVDVQSPGTYDIELRVACNGDGRTLSLSMDGDPIATNVAIPNTAGWQTWQTVTVNDIALEAGVQILRLTIGNTDYVNLNHVTFLATDIVEAPEVTLTAPTNNSTFTMLETVTLNASVTPGDNAVSSVAFFADEELLGTDNTAPYTFDWSGMDPGIYELTAVVTDSEGLEGTSTPISVTIEGVQTPYNGTAHNIPGRIEAEEYDLGGEGLGYHEANTTGNQGNADFRGDGVDIEVTSDTDGEYNIAYILNGEWLEYTVNVTTTGLYNLSVRVARDGDNGAFHVQMDGNNISGTIAVPNTGGWQVWETVTINDISLTAGEHVMRIAFDSDYMNLNYVAFAAAVVDTDNDGVEDNEDACPQDHNKSASEGECGCGVADTDTDADGIADCKDTYPNDADNDGIATIDDCDDNNPFIGEETRWYADTDNDGVGDASTSLMACTQPDGYVASSGDACPEDINKTSPGDCGCGATEESCLDCAGEPNGDAAEDACGTCAGGSTGITPVTNPDECIATGIENVNQSFEIYPNPFSDGLKVNNDGEFTYSIYAVSGTLIEVGEGNDQLIIGKELTPGMYMLKIENTRGSFIKRIIKL